MNKKEGAAATARTGLEIAVIGMAGRFPGARNIDEYWQNLKNGVESITFFSDSELEEAGVDKELLKKPNYIKAYGHLKDKDVFDAAFFGYSPKEAELMDPQVRIFHECVWEALEDAGYNPDTYEGKIGLYAGASNSFGWQALSTLTGKSEEFGSFASLQLIDKDFLCSKISYNLNLKGACSHVHSACSTSLVAIHTACRALLTGESDIVLAGGSSVSSNYRNGYFYQEGMIFSADGHCRAFDSRATGTVVGEGAGVVVLKRLKPALDDGDRIDAIIKGTAINNDGRRKVGYTAPSIEGEAEVIRTAQRMARMESESITYVETHGTGTSLGDPVEIEALKLAFNTQRRNFCGIGSVKTNFGHLDTASGVAGFIKTVLSLKHKLIPPSLHFEKPNPKIDFENSPFYVNVTAKKWENPHYPLRAGVSSFGIGGTNCHVVLEEAPSVLPPEGNRAPSYKSKLLILSAKDLGALDQATVQLGEFLKKKPDINPGDMAYTLQVGRKAFLHRRMVVCPNVADAIAVFSNSDLSRMKTVSLTDDKEKQIIFMFPGQGSQYVNMGRQLYEKESTFRQEMDRCFEILKSLMPYPIEDILYPPSDGRREIGHPEEINHTEIAQPFLFAFEYSLAKLLAKWGIIPNGMIGHSIGEFAAACLAGVFSLEDALRLVVNRGKWMQEMPKGAMVSVSIGEEELMPLLAGYRDISLAAVNSPSNCVVAGPFETIELFEQHLVREGYGFSRLHTSHAFHSVMMEPMLERFEACVKGVSLNAPQLPYLSNVTGKWITPQAATDPRYWSRHIRNTVRFADGIAEILGKGKWIFIEVGPGKTLINLVKQINEGKESPCVSLVRHPRETISDEDYLLNAVGNLWLYGKSMDWGKFYEGEKRYRLSLPTYPFNGERFWFGVDSIKAGVDRLKQISANVRKADMGDWFYVPVWQQSISKPLEPMETATWLVFMEDKPFDTALIDGLIRNQQQVIRVEIGDRFTSTGDNDDGTHGRYTVNPKQTDDYDSLFQDLIALNRIPQKIIHMWNVTGPDTSRPELKELDAFLDKGFFSLLNIAQAIGRAHITDQIIIHVLTDNMMKVTGEEALFPEKALVVGAIKVIPLEYPNIKCRCVDMTLPACQSPQEYTVLNRLMAELASDADEKYIAYRGKQRWVEVFRPFKLEQSNRITRFKEKGVYLITGGFGGMGFSIAEYLAKAFNARLILIGRSFFPPREQWEQWVKTHEDQDENVKRIKKIREWEAAGAIIFTFCADVSNPEQMQAVMVQVNREFNHINGVIHAAGEADYGGAIQKRTHEITDRYMACKLKGTLIIDQLLKDIRLDFLVLFSSIGNVLYSWKFGQVSYNASNEFLEAYANYYSSRHDSFVTAINWCDWKQVGMSVKALKRQHGEIDVDAQRPDALLPSEGIEVFMRVMESQLNRVTVFSFDLLASIERQEKKMLANAVGENLATEVETASAAASKKRSAKRPELSTPYAAPATDVERIVVGIWEGLLGIEDVGIYDDFFELGGDSLKAMTVIAHINKKLKIQIPLAVFFKNPTVEQMGHYIDDTRHVKQTHVIGINPGEEKEYYPLSAAQKRLFFLYSMERESFNYNQPQLLVLSGTYDLGQFERAVRTIIERHDSLRTSFEMINGDPVQRIHKRIAFELGYHEIKEEAVNGYLKTFLRPFQLEKAPLFRIDILKIQDEKYLIMLDIHHIISDGISNNLFKEEILLLYNGEQLPPLKLQYKDFSEWQNSKEEKENIKRQEHYWMTMLEGELPLLNLPTDYPRPLIQSFEGTSLHFELDREPVLLLSELAQAEGATLYMVLLTIVNIWLSKLSHQDDIIIGTPIAGRRHADLKDIIGMFVNMLSLRNFPNGAKTFKAFLREVKEGTLGAFENQDYPYSDLVSHLSLVRDTSHNPLFDVVFTFQNTELNAIDPRKAANVEKSVSPSSSVNYRTLIQTSPFDLTLIAHDLAGTLDFEIQYRTKLFDGETIQRFIGYFNKVVSEILRDKRRDIRISELEILSDSEKKRILLEFNNTAANYPKEKTIHRLFEEQVERAPDHIAVIHSLQLTYRELNDHANRLAFILSAQGISPDTVIGIKIERNTDMIIGILGILKSGAAYLPLDPEYPEERITFMLTDSGAKMVLTQDFITDAISATGPRVHPPHDRTTTSNHTAYIIYTSGTTGRPKGVLIEHRNVVRLFFNDRCLYDFNGRDIWTLFHSYCFDFSVWEMYGALLFGGKLVVLPKIVCQDPCSFLTVLQEKKVTILNQTPSAFYNLIHEELKSPACSLYLRYVIFGGEALSPIKIKEWKEKYPGTQMINMFGITETTVHVTYKQIDDKSIGANISCIGTPIPTLSVYLFEPGLILTPIGVAGELCVGGSGVGRGYLNLPELTHEKFIRNPFQKKDRLYKSGDLARWFDNGEMEYLGRIDHQIQIRGHRVEVGEIEHRLLQHPDIQDVVVLVKEDKETNKYLTAYFVSRSQPSISQLRAFLSKQLPDYMIPAYFAQISHIPITSNGKIDKQKLPEPEVISGEAFTPPASKIEEELLDAWNDVLELKKIGVNDNFFNIGGDSIKAIRLINLINKRFDTNLRVLDLFTNTTIREFATVLEKETVVESGNELEKANEAIEKLKSDIMGSGKVPEGVEDIFPMSDIEKGMTYHAYKNPDVAIYHDQFVYYRKYSNFEPDILKFALELLMKRHSILRTSYNLDDFDQFVHFIHKPFPPVFKHFDISGETSEAQRGFIEKYLINDRNERWDISKPPLCRLATFDLGSDNICAVWTFHHAILDGWSNASLMTELNNTYLQLKIDKNYIPPALKISFKEFITNEIAEKMKVSNLNFWKNELENYKRTYFPSVNKNEPDVMHYLNPSIGKDLNERLFNATKRYNTSLKHLCFAAYVYMLSMLSYENDVVVGLLSNNRPEMEDGDKIIGCFLNTLPFRLRIPDEISCEQYVHMVDKKILELKPYDKVTFFEIVNMIGERNRAENAIFDTIFNYIDFHIFSQAKDEVNQASYDGNVLIQGYERTNTLFNFNVSPVPQAVKITIVYSTSIIGGEWVRKLYGYFEKILERIVSTPQAMLKKENIISDNEKQQLLDDFNNTSDEYPKETNVLWFFEKQVNTIPDHISIIGQAAGTGDMGPKEPFQLSYRQLDRQANVLARALMDKGVGREDIIGIMVERSIEMIIGIFGILKAGCAYLPIDPTHPKDRVDFILKDSGATLLVRTNNEEDKKIRSSEGKKALFIEHLILSPSQSLNLLNSHPLTFPSPSVNSVSSVRNNSRFAYIIYTSGTTGKPKGVMIEHHSLVNRLNWMQKKYPLDENDTILQKTTYTFDVSVWELFWWSMAGAKLGLLIPGGEKDPGVIMQTIQTQRVTTMHFVPSMLGAFLDYLTAHGQEKRLVSLKRIFASGEALLPAHVERFNGLLTKENRTRLINLYGPTEATIDVSYFDCGMEETEIIPIGRPIDNIRLYILDSYLHLQPVGVSGELYISGVGLARGYLNRPELTSEKFICCRLSDAGCRLYQTGDLSRWLPDGNIEFLGRIDHQVKVRGYRIELGEIENRLLNHVGIKDAVVIAYEATDEDKYLGAYIVSDHDYSTLELREYLAKELPDYMIPSVFVQLSKIPLLANGKVDRSALPEPGLNLGGCYAGPRNEIETVLVKIWSDVLGLPDDRVGIDDNFFALGGHSLKTILMVSRLHKEMHVRIPLAEIFKRSTIRALADYIRGKGETPYASIEPVEEKEYYELSSAQKRLYILQQMEMENTAYIIRVVIPLGQGVEITVVEDSFQKLIARHESLRTSFHLINDEPVQRIHREVEFKMTYFLTGNESRMNGRDLTKAPLMRVGLRQREGSQVLLVDLHHIITDGISQEVLTQDFMRLYNGEALTPLRIQYKDFSEWQNSNKEKRNDQEIYWLGQFEGDIPVLTLCTDYPRPLFQSYEGDTIDLEISNEITRQIRQLTREHEVTLYMMLLAAVNILFAKLSGQEDIVIGSPVAGRRHADLEKIIGMFVNTLALRNYPSGEKRFDEFLKELKERALEAFENQEYQFEDLVERVIVNRDTGRNPLFDVMFAVQNMDRSDQDQFKNEPILPSQDRDKVQSVSKFDLEINVWETGQSLNIRFRYCTKLFKEDTIQRFMIYFYRILTKILQEPGVKIKDIEFITDEEKNRLLYEFNHTSMEYPRDKTIHELFEEQAVKSPDHIAVLGATLEGVRQSSLQLSYRELQARANRLADRLIQGGIRPDAIVGIQMERSVEMIIGIFGILKANGAYLPIRPNYPKDRIDFMLKDSGAALLLTSNNAETKRIRSSEGKMSIEELLRTSQPLNLSPSQPLYFLQPAISLAYIIYTSGTTGKPKGVAIEHHSVVNRLHWMQRTYPLNESDIILQKTTFTFDVSVWEIFWWSLVGARVCLLTPGGEKDAQVIIQTVKTEHITTMHFVPSMLRVFLDHLKGQEKEKEKKKEKEFVSLRRIFASGEPLLPLDLKCFNELLGTQSSVLLVNLYGPTEATIDVSYFDCGQEDTESIPIGKPIDNIGLYIWNKSLHLQPIGVPGELGISGVGLARGYLNRPELTSETFIKLKHGSFSVTVYKTGDLARRLDDGNIEFLGRIDSQVKIRGFRIELGEIESRLLTHPEIKEAVVLARETQDGDKFLCAYTLSDRECSASELRDYLSKELPDYMIPLKFVKLEKIPLTANGKLDRSALPEPELGGDAGYVGPRNDIETQLVQLWSDMFSQPPDKIGIDDNFFELGGHSLKAMIMVSRIHKALDVRLPLAEIFKTPVIRGLAQCIKKAEADRYLSIENVEEKHYYPLSPSQQRMYIAQQMNTESTGYNMCLMAELEGVLSQEKLTMALNQLIERHDSLRTSFLMLEGMPVQRIHEPQEIEFDVQYHEIINNPAMEQETIKRFTRPFDLSKPPLLRVSLITRREGGYILMVNMHHIISDGVSMTIVVEEFLDLYVGKALPFLKLQYKDFSEWQNRLKNSEEMNKQKEYWLRQFKNDIPSLNLPLDYPRPEVSDIDAGRHVNFSLDNEVCKKIYRLTGSSQVTLSMILMAGYYLLLHRFTNREDIVIGIVVNGRTHPDLEKIVGVFVNTLPIRNYPQRHKVFAEFLEEVKANTLQAFENQGYPFDELVKHIGVQGQSNRNPLVDVAFNLDNIEKTELRPGDFKVKPYESNLEFAKFDLTLYAVENKGTINLNFRYSTQLFKHSTIEKLKQYYIEIIGQVVNNIQVKLQDIKVTHQRVTTTSKAHQFDDDEFIL
ncbi:MAG: amino acid adenylation domain-containing protein [Candidatus Omnitrophota bacterium]